MNTHHHFQFRCQEPFATDGAQVPGAKGIAPGTGQEDPDPDWRPI